jgi:hypothetical protein
MENSYSALPTEGSYQGYELAYKLACEQLAKIDDIEQQCRRSGAQYLEIDSQKVIILEYLNQSYQVTLPDVDITLVDSQEEVPIRDKVLILHYLTLAKGTPIANKMITFKELPEGANYFPTFSKRTIEPLLDHFGKKPHRLADAAGKLGGYKVDYGDVAVTINAFSHVPITLVLWRGDEEFAPAGSIIFDATISDYLSTEDITVLCETITWKLVKSLKEILPD